MLLFYIEYYERSVLKAVSPKAWKNCYWSNKTQDAVGAPEYLGILIHFSVAVLQFILALALVAKALLPTLSKPLNPAQPPQRD